MMGRALPAHLDALRHGEALYPKPIPFTPTYGTAGFRALAERLPSTVYRFAVTAYCMLLSP